jgi:hypothetical protein
LRKAKQNDVERTTHSHTNKVAVRMKVNKSDNKK